jgi:predicted ATPase/class 3 adenylate cyclase/DNA-binding CsgD family transcriptional regulator
MSTEVSSRALPAGTVTLILADVVGSVRLWELDPSNMRSAIGRMEELATASTSRFKGNQPTEQGEGDSFVAAFSRASDAIACALDIQLSFAKESWPGDLDFQVRMALHTGEAEIDKDGKYSGPSVNRCARLRDLAHGSQTLVSQTTYEVGADALPDQVRLRDLGRHRLRDLARLERVYQLIHPDLPDAFPPLRSLDAIPNNLPLQLTSFIGRGSEVSELMDLLAQNRIVTLTGAGGCGKTRLALHVVAEVIDDYPDGVWWVDLAPISDPEVVAAKVAANLSVRESESEPVTKALIDQLREKHLVLILDNCEHLLSASADLASALLVACPSVRVIATSREPLGVSGEVSYRVPSLSFPKSEDESNGDYSAYESIHLFIERARLVRPKFDINRENAEAIRRICRRLDGIPLAIELAAARTRLLNPTQISEALSGQFDILTGGARNVLPRQRTLEASIAWSYELLDEAERRLLARLSVFSGTFSMQAVEEVCSDETIDRYRVLDLLSGLTDKSLVQVEDNKSESRYRLLEAVRAFALQKLTDFHEASDIRTRHLIHYVALSERAGQELRGRKFADWAAKLTEEIDNLRAAMEWALSSKQEEEHLRITAALLPFWIVRSLYSEVRRTMQAALSAEVEPAVRVKALSTAAMISVFADQYKSAHQLGQECVRLAREVGDEHSVGWGLLYLGWAEFWLGRGGLENVVEAGRTAAKIPDAVISAHAYFYRGIIEGYMNGLATARPLLEGAITAARASGDEFALSNATFFSGSIHWMGGRFPEARLLLEESVDVSRRIDNRTFLSFALGELGWSVAQQGDYSRAEALTHEALEIARDLSGTVESNARLNLAFLQWAQGNLDAFDEEQIVATRNHMKHVGLAWFIEGTNWALGAFSLARGKHVQARERLQEARESARGKHSFPWVLGHVLDSLGRLSRAEGDFSSAESLFFEAIDVLYRYGDLAGTCDVLESIAGTATELQSLEEAVRLFGAAARLREEIGFVRFPVYRSGYEADVATARASLGEGDFDRRWAEGLALSLEEAVAYASRGRGSRKRPALGWESLSPTEREVVKLVAGGHSNPEIAKRLFISRNTVKVHLSHVFAKLGLTSRAELAAEATRRGI